MNGLGGLNKSPNGVVVGVVQLQLPVVVTPADLAAQTQKIVATVGKARRNMATMDLVVFPEYSLHGLSMDMNPEIMCSLEGPEIARVQRRLPRQPHLGLLLRHGVQPVWESLQFGRDHRRHGSAPALLPQDASLDARSSPGSLAISVSPSAMVRRARSSRSSSATTACFPRWRGNALTRAPKS